MDYGTAWDNAGVSEKKEFEPIPPGVYCGKIIEAKHFASGEKKTKDGLPIGEHVEFTYLIEDGEYEGRRVWSFSDFEKSFWKFRRVLEAFGISKVRTLEDVKAALSTIVNKYQPIEFEVTSFRTKSGKVKNDALIIGLDKEDDEDIPF